MQLQLDRDEAHLLYKILSTTLEDLRVEVHHSSGHEFRANLKHREALLHRILGELERGEGAGPATPHASP